MPDRPPGEDPDDLIEMPAPPRERRGMAVLRIVTVLGFGVLLLSGMPGPYPLLDGGSVLLGSVIAALGVLGTLKLAPLGERVGPAYLLMGCLPWVLAATLVANGALDHSPETVHQTTAISTSRASPLYIVEVRSWRPGRSTETLYLHRGFFIVFNASVRQPFYHLGQPVAVGVRQGALGLPWIDSLSGE